MADSLPKHLAAFANRLLGPLGLHLVRSERAFEMDGLLARAARRHDVRTWIDVGASDGSWSLRARRHFPTAAFLLFEPLAERQAALQHVHATHGFHIVTAAAGAAPGTVSFAVDPELDGSSVAAGPAPNARQVRVETVGAAVAARRLPGPYGLKLDTHGFEIPVLEGAASILDQTELLVIEAYNFQLTPTTLRFHELCAWLEARGFRCCDLADAMRRPGDGALWQVDLAFARARHPIFATNRYA